MQDASYAIPGEAVIGLIIRDLELLAIRRSSQVRAPNKICFPGGGIQAGESIEEALIREMNEELGLLVQPVCCVWKSVSPWQVPLHWWKVDVANLDHLSPAAEEVADCFWAGVEELLEEPELLQSNREFLDRVRQDEVELF